MIVDFFIRSRRDTKLQFTEIFNVRAISAYLIGIIVSIPFMYPSSYYVGPIAKKEASDAPAKTRIKIFLGDDFTGRYLE